MFTCKVENSKGEILELTHNDERYQIISVGGTNPPHAIVNLSKIAMIDGSKYNSSQLSERNIVIMVKLNGDVEANRIALYAFFRSKEWCRIHYANGTRSVYIDGYVESIEVNPFSKAETVQISIICPNPYFKDEQRMTQTFKKVIEQFEFPFAIAEEGISFSLISNETALIINNSSERETGLTIEINIADTCNRILIRKLSTGERFTLNYQFAAYDKVIIDTNKGSKSIKLIRNAVTTNIFTAMVSGSSFFQLELGDNVFDYSVDNGTHDERAEVYFKYNFLYGGI